MKHIKLVIGAIGYHVFVKYLRITGNRPQVLDSEQTVKHILHTKSSVSRYGDGELLWALQKRENGNFEKNSPLLAKRLQEILRSKKENLAICIPNVFNGLNTYKTDGKLYWEGFVIKRSFQVLKIIPKDRIYYNSFFTRPYMDLKNKNEYDFETYFSLVRQIWDNRNVLIIEGEKTRFGMNNDLLCNVKSTKRIICPSKNAFESYDEIISKTQNIANKIEDPVILIALGPTATVLAYDLSEEFQAIDIGHLDIEYEWYRMNAKEKRPVTGKYVSEVHLHFISELPDLELTKYKSEIVAKIGGRSF